jgi:DNA-binding transcriptional LysR family regulator
MEFKQLRHFVAVIESGTVSAAAVVLCITQPALTRSIKSLEARLHAKLLERQPRGIAPTEAGTRLYHRAKMILNETENTASDVTATANGERGSLNIGVAAMFAGDPMAEVVARLAKAAPGLTLNVTEGFYEDLITDLKIARIEALITNFPPGTADEELVFEPLISVRSQFVISTSHPLARKSRTTYADLRDCQLALVRQAHVSSLLADLFVKENLTMRRPAIETNSLSLLRSLVLSGNYASLLPEHLLEQDIADGRIKRLELNGTPFERSSGLILRYSEARRPAVQYFIEATRASFADWPGLPA